MCSRHVCLAACVPGVIAGATAGVAKDGAGSVCPGVGLLVRTSSVTSVLLQVGSVRPAFRGGRRSGAPGFAVGEVGVGLERAGFLCEGLCAYM